MRVTRKRDYLDWVDTPPLSAGQPPASRTGVVLDTVYSGPYGEVNIRFGGVDAPPVFYTAAAIWFASAPFSITGCAGWRLEAPSSVDGILISETYKDSIYIQANGYGELTIYFSYGIECGVGVQSGEGDGCGTFYPYALVGISVDGVPYGPEPQVDPNLVQSVTVQLDGNPHLVRFQNLGITGTEENPVTPPSSTSFAGAWHSTESTLQYGIQDGYWQLTASSSSTYTLSRQINGVWQVIAAGLSTNTTYDANMYIPGIAFSIQGSITPGDVATFGTTAVSFAVGLASTSALVNNVSNPTIVSPVWDGGVSGIVWAMMTWDYDAAMTAPLSSIQIRTNDYLSELTLSPWITALLPTPQVKPSIGNKVGAAGWGQNGVGRYFQVQLVGSSNTVALSNVEMYTWTPSVQVDDSLLRRMAWPDNTIRLMPNAYSVLALWNSLIAKAYDRAKEEWASLSIAQARGEWLALKGEEIGMPAVGGEPESVYADRLALCYTLLCQGKVGAYYIAAVLGHIVSGTRQPVVQVTNGWTCSGVLVTRTAAYQVAIQCPSGTYAGLPNVAAAQVEQNMTAMIAYLPLLSCTSTLTFV